MNLCSVSTKSIVQLITCQSSLLFYTPLDLDHTFRTKTKCDGRLVDLEYPEKFQVKAAIQRCADMIGCSMVVSQVCNADKPEFALCIDGKPKSSHAACSWIMNKGVL